MNLARETKVVGRKRSGADSVAAMALCGTTNYERPDKESLRVSRLPTRTTRKMAMHIHTDGAEAMLTEMSAAAYLFSRGPPADLISETVSAIYTFGGANYTLVSPVMDTQCMTFPTSKGLAGRFFAGDVTTNPLTWTTRGTSASRSTGSRGSVAPSVLASVGGVCVAWLGALLVGQAESLAQYTRWRAGQQFARILAPIVLLVLGLGGGWAAHVLAVVARSAGGVRRRGLVRRVLWVFSTSRSASGELYTL